MSRAKQGMTECERQKKDMVIFRVKEIQTEVYVYVGKRGGGGGGGDQNDGQY